MKNLRWGKSEFRYFLRCLLLFCFLYEIVPLGVSTRLSTRKLAFVVMVFAFLCRCQYAGVRKHVLAQRDILQLFCAEVCVTVFSAGWIVWRASAHQLDSGKILYANGVYFLLFTLIGSIVLVYIFRDFREFLCALTTVSLWQSALIFLQASSSAFRNWLAGHIYANSSIGFQSVRASGVGASGSWVSVLLFFGVVASGYFVITEKKTVRHWVKILLMVFAQFLTGATGVYLSALYILYILYVKSRDGKRFVGRAALYGTGMILLGVAALYMLKASGNQTLSDTIDQGFRKIFSKSAYITKTGGGFFGAWSRMKSLPLSYETFWGYGLSRGDLGNGAYAHHDSGYVNRYIADGLFMAVVEYSTLLALMLVIWRKIQNKLTRRYFFFLILCLYGIEIKEGYFYQYVAVGLVLAILLSAVEAQGGASTYYGADMALERLKSIDADERRKPEL